ncbi:hypothetical protein D3C86_2122860 [compost metagenome]
MGKIVLKKNTKINDKKRNQTSTPIENLLENRPIKSLLTKNQTKDLRRLLKESVLAFSKILVRKRKVSFKRFKKSNSK